MALQHNSEDIHEAAGEGRVQEVKAYLKGGGLIDKRDADRWTPLMMAVREGHLEVAQTLLRNGANFEARDGDKWTAMHVAAANGHPQCCQLLLDRGANLRVTDDDRRTPLHWAARYGYGAVVELLLKRGADTTAQDSDGKTPYGVIGADLSEDSREVVTKLLLEHEQRVKACRQRRESCPGVSRTANVEAVHPGRVTSPGTSSPPRAGTPSPLPSVAITKTATAGSTAAEGVRPAPRASSGSRASYSSEPHIREHRPRVQPQSADAMATASESTSTLLSAPSLTTVDDCREARFAVSSITPTTDWLPQRGLEERGADGVAVAIGDGGAHLPAGDGSQVRDTGELEELRRALRDAEERARKAEQERLAERELRLRQEAEARLLHERIAGLERLIGRA